MVQCIKERTMNTIKFLAIFGFMLFKLESGVAINLGAVTAIYDMKDCHILEIIGGKRIIITPEEYERMKRIGHIHTL